MRRILPTLALFLAATGLPGCSGRLGLAQGGPRASGPAASPRAEGGVESPPARPELPRVVVDAICDRVEDCAVERNTTLARESGGGEDDVEAARNEAREALVSGAVRAFCLLRVKRLEATDAERIHGCLKAEQGCAGFYRCADFSRAGARPQPTPARHRADARQMER